MNYKLMSDEELRLERENLEGQYNNILLKKLSLDMSRGKPGKEQLEMSESMLTAIGKNSDCYAADGTDCRNYGLVDGIPEAKKLFADVLEVCPDEVIVGGNSSLNLMYDALSRCMLYGVYGGNGPWIKNKSNKFLCPVPGYDRHFGICQSLGIEMINLPMTKDGPNMDIVEELVKDEDVRGIWCVPKYSNPTGITYSDEIVERFANLHPASPDFRIFWDDAYCIHDLYPDRKDVLKNILAECKKKGNENLPFIFASTSKITYPGSGVSVICASKQNIEQIKGIMKMQTIGHDKMNMLRHVKYFGSADGMKKYMQKHAEVLRPKFEKVISGLENNVKEYGIAEWSNPNGGYFISLDVLPGCAKKVVEMCKNAGVKLTDAGATFPYGKDPDDRNIRIAPSYPSEEELALAVEVLCVCIKLVSVEKIINEK